MYVCVLNFKYEEYIIWIERELTIKWIWTTIYTHMVITLQKVSMESYNVS